MGDARYTVKNIETIAESSDIRARLYTLAPDDVIPWHYHSTVTDWYFCLGGTLRIETRAPRGEESLTRAVGMRSRLIPPIASLTAATARIVGSCCCRALAYTTSTRSRNNRGGERHHSASNNLKTPASAAFCAGYRWFESISLQQ